MGNKTNYLGHWIKIQRVALRYSRSDLSNATQITKARLINIELGREKPTFSEKVVLEEQLCLRLSSTASLPNRVASNKFDHAAQQL